MTFPEIFDSFKNHSYIRRECWSNDVFINLRYTAPLIREVVFKIYEDNDFQSKVMYETYKKTNQLPKKIVILNNDVRLSADDLLADDWEDINKININKFMVKPIKPSDIQKIIPDWVIQGANDCINEHWNEIKKSSKFTQDSLIEHILKYAPSGVTRETLFDNNWLDIEPIYEKEGWVVSYDKPMYYETYEPNFTFTI